MNERDLTAVASFAGLTSPKARSVDEVCDCFEHQLNTRNGPAIESLLAGFPEPERSILLRELLFLELEGFLLRDTQPKREKYFQRFPEHTSIVQEVLTELFPPTSQPVSHPDELLPAIPNYRILRKLSHGGMGTVYEAMHTELGNRVAIKVLRPNLARDLEAEVRFKREMKVIGTLAHGNIVQARDAGKACGTHYLVMEYLVGLDLAELVRRLGPLPATDACEIARRIALALEYAHQHNLVHRDVKPKNVLFGRSYGADEPVQVKVADFGLALLRGYPRPRDAGTSPEIVGTLAFMAPEQYWEQISDIRSDVYSLGCTLYYLLLSRPPFGPLQYPDAKQLMDAHRRTAIPLLRKLRPDVSQSLEEIILAMLAKNPCDRPETPIKVAERLGEFTAGYDLSRLLIAAERTLEHQESNSNSSEPSSPLTPIQHVAETTTVSLPGSPDETPRAHPSEPPSRPAESVVVGGRQLANRTRRMLLLMFAPAAIALIWLVASYGLRLRLPEPMDLLHAVDPARDAFSGEWQIHKDVLVSPDAPHARLALRCRVPTAYRLEIEARRQSGGRLVIGLIRDGRQVPIVLDSAVVGFVPPIDNSAAEASRKLAATLGFTSGPPNTYTCIVHREGLLVAFENQIRLTIGLDNTPAESADEWRIPGNDSLFVGTHHSVYHIHRITLTSIRP